MNREWCDKNVRVVSYSPERRGIVTLAGRHVDWNWYLLQPGWELMPLHTAGLYRMVKVRRPKS